MSAESNDPYAAERRVAECIDHIRELSRDLYQQTISFDKLGERSREHAQKISKAVGVAPEITNTVYLVSGGNMTHYEALAGSDEDETIVRIVHTPVQVDELGIEEIPVTLQTVTMDSEDIGNGQHRLVTNMIFDRLEPNTLTISRGSALMAGIALSQSIIFPAHSTDSLVVPILQSLEKRQVLYRQLLRSCPDAKWFAERLRQFEQVLCDKDPVELKDVEDLTIVNGMAEYAEDIIKAYPEQKDTVLSLVSEVIGRERQLLVQSAGARTVIGDTPREVFSMFGGKFVAAVTCDWGEEKLVAVIESQVDKIIRR